MQEQYQFKNKLLYILRDFLEVNPINMYNDIQFKNVLATSRKKSRIDLTKFKNTRYQGYMASERGEIYSTKSGLILSPRIDKDGYEEVSIMIDKKQTSKTVHRIIAETWIPNPYNLPYVNHINGNRSDNRVTNLEWASVSANNMNINKNNGPQYNPKYKWQYQPKRLQKRK